MQSSAKKTFFLIKLFSVLKKSVQRKREEHSLFIDACIGATICIGGEIQCLLQNFFYILLSVNHAFVHIPDIELISFLIIEQKIIQRWETHMKA